MRNRQSRLANARENLRKAQRMVKELESKEERRHKFILAEAVLLAVKKNALSDKALEHILNTYVTKKSDREFLGLAPLNAASNGSAVAQHQPQPQPEYQHN